MPRVFAFQLVRRLLCLVFLAGLTLLAGAQQLPKLAGQDQPSSEQSSPDQSQTREDAMSTLKVNVDVVQLFFNVKDKKGGLIPNLSKDDFQIFEDGKPQTIKYFAAESNLPLTLGILIDASGSQERVLPMEKEAGGAFLSEILRAKDLAFVLSFDVNVDLLQDFTNSVPKLKSALDHARINTGGGVASVIPGLGGGGPVPTAGNQRGTLLYDAIYLASH